MDNSIKNIAKFIREETQFLNENQDYAGGWLKMDGQVAVVIAWEDGFDPADVDLFHAESNPEYCLCVGLRIYNPSDTPDGWNFIYDEESGDLITESGAIAHKDLSVEGSETVARWIYDTYMELSDYEIDDSGAARLSVDEEDFEEEEIDEDDIVDEE